MKPSIVKGWHWPKKDYTRAQRENKLLKLVTETSNICNLSCSGCYTKKDEGSWTDKGKKRLSDEMSLDDQLDLIDEAVEIGVRSADIVGAGEPLLDRNHEQVIGYMLNSGLHVVVFTHGAVPRFSEAAERWADNSLSFFLKLWSKNPSLQQAYVGGSVRDYTDKRDEAIDTLIELGFNDGEELNIDGIQYKTTRIGADILVMKSNYREIPDLFRFCRENNIMPEIKTYIPEGPTRFTEGNPIYHPGDLEILRRDEITPQAFQELREELVRIDKEYGIPELPVLYPQGCKCTQSMASMYVTIQGDVHSCVGTQFNYGKYEQGMLREAVENRKERVGFGCIPRLEDAKARGITISPELKMILEGI